MTRYLLATASVHTTAAAADHLGDRLTADDEVVVVTVAEPDLDARAPATPPTSPGRVCSPRPSTCSNARANPPRRSAPFSPSATRTWS
ncbi:hypothetical protein ACFQL4_20870 [Halosimplex aquaticum]